MREIIIIKKTEFNKTERKKPANTHIYIYIEYKSTNLLCVIQCGKAYENIASISICCPLLIHSLDDM